MKEHTYVPYILTHTHIIWKYARLKAKVVVENFSLVTLFKYTLIQKIKAIYITVKTTII